MLLLSIDLFSNYYLLPTSNEEILTEEKLKDKTLHFLTYARNEIFARKGYIFDTKDLDLYFSNMSWYNKKSKNVSLSEVEKLNVNLLKKIEDEKKHTFPLSPAGVMFQYSLNDKPLFYIGLVVESFTKKYYRKGKLLLLDNDNNWVINCKSIPYEYLQDNCISEVNDINDSVFAISDSTRIKVFDINNDNIQEILIHTNPESGSGNGTFKIIKLSDRKLTMIFNQKGKFINLEKITNSIFKINLLFKIDAFHAGTSFITSTICNLHYQTVTQIPFHYKKINTKTYNTYKCIEKVPVYFDAVSAANNNYRAIIDSTLKNTNFLFDEFYFLKPQMKLSSNPRKELKAIKIKTIDEEIGWINYNIDSFRKSFYYMAAGG